MPEPIVFRSEDSLWNMLETGERTFDPRRWDVDDQRIYRLAWGRRDKILVGGIPTSGQTLDGAWEPIEKQVSFLNKADGRLLTFEYRGMEFAPWAPGWCFLILGRKLS